MTTEVATNSDALNSSPPDDTDKTLGALTKTDAATGSDAVVPDGDQTGEQEDDVDEVAPSADAEASVPTIETAAREVAVVPSAPLNFEIHPEAVRGLIQGLASTIPAKGTTMLTIAKLANDELLVTIIPARGEKETESAIPLQVRGTAQEIDEHLLSALSGYVPARHIAIATAEEIVRRTAAAAKTTYTAKPAVKATPAKTAPTKPVVPQKKAPSITVYVTPANASLRLLDLKTSQQIDIEHGKPTELKRGFTYSLMATASGFATHIETLSFSNDDPLEKNITLKAAAPTLLDGVTA